MARLNSEDILPLLRALSEPTPAVRLAALRAVVRLPLQRDAWRLVEQQIDELLDQEPEGQGFDQQTLNGIPYGEVIQAAVHVPSNAMRRRLAELLMANDPDLCYAVMTELASAWDAAALGSLLQYLQEGQRQRGGSVRRALRSLQRAQRYAGIASEQDARRVKAARLLSGLDVREREAQTLDVLQNESNPEVAFWLALALAGAGRIAELRAALRDLASGKFFLSEFHGDPLLLEAALRRPRRFHGDLTALKRLLRSDLRISAEGQLPEVVSGLLRGLEPPPAPERPAPSGISPRLAAQIADELQRHSPYDRPTRSLTPEEIEQLRSLSTPRATRLASALFRDLAKRPGHEFDYENGLVDFTYNRQQRFKPDIPALSASYRKVFQERPLLGRQIAWAVSRAGARAVVQKVSPSLRARQQLGRLAAARLIEEAARYLDQDAPPRFGGGEEPPETLALEPDWIDSAEALSSHRPGHAGAIIEDYADQPSPPPVMSAAEEEGLASWMQQIQEASDSARRAVQSDYAGGAAQADEDTGTGTSAPHPAGAAGDTSGGGTGTRPPSIEIGGGAFVGGDVRRDTGTGTGGRSLSDWLGQAGTAPPPTSGGEAEPPVNTNQPARASADDRLRRWVERPPLSTPMVGGDAARRERPHARGTEQGAGGGLSDVLRRLVERPQALSGSAPAPRIRQRTQRRQRVVNTGFVPRAKPDNEEFTPRVPLRVGMTYYFWIDIGAPVRYSGEVTPTALPQVPVGTVLTVVLFGHSDSLLLTPGADEGELRIKGGGQVIVKTQPLGKRAPASRHYQRRLFFPVQAPDTPGHYALRCNIYAGQILLQSRLVEADVLKRGGRPPEKQGGYWRSTLDYTLSNEMEAAGLVRLETEAEHKHKLSVMLNDNGDGTHSFYFRSTEAADRIPNHDVRFGEGELFGLISQARQVLRSISWGDGSEWNGQPYCYEPGTFDLARLREDLVRLAKWGREFYVQVGSRLGDMQLRRLEGEMRTPGYVQIAMKESPNYILPAAMIYDYPLKTVGTQYDICPEFLENLRNGAALENTRCFQGDCPSYGIKTTVCPSGFWGFRHWLGMPLSVHLAPQVPATIGYSGSVQMVMGESTNMQLLRDHEQTICGLSAAGGALRVQHSEHPDTLLEWLEQPPHPHLVYFYCHGGLQNDAPFLELGTPEAPEIVLPSSLVDLLWDGPRPLVFINGCHTTAVDPMKALQFIRPLVEECQCAGVIGTEITVFEPMAAMFAEEFFCRLLHGESTGRALRGARLKVLSTGNPLGLVYIPFVLGTIKLEAS